MTAAAALVAPGDPPSIDRLFPFLRGSAWADWNLAEALHILAKIAPAELPAVAAILAGVGFEAPSEVLPALRALYFTFSSDDRRKLHALAISGNPHYRALVRKVLMTGPPQPDPRVPDSNAWRGNSPS
jgi:hypothetical protein